ncbi:MAG: hypothetical protein H3C35_11895 [Bacteroidetes bacterium]|nr:hypothetical protein [Bacteroidota bacterium]
MKHSIKHLHSGSCADIYRHLCENLDSQFETEECKRIREHIEQCDTCSALLDSLKKTVYLYKQETVPAMPKTLEKKLFAVIKLKKKQKHSPGK